ncbi:MAG: aldolase/citrate lyase family protein [Acidobacteriota bacterium]|nr:aldolase/citrate lyase family protein [Acidobacteriota bacterium]
MSTVPSLVAQPAIRHNRLIEALEQGEPAITGEVWTFIDQEHGPYVIDQLGTRLGELALERNDRGQQILAPIVRIPAEGDQSLRWIVKQVLERGAMGIIVPQVENAEQATRIVQSVRYPQRKESRFPTPVGRRGFAGAPRTWGLKVLDYLRVADAWPLNPDGELFVMPMIETAEGVVNVTEILAVPGVGGVLVGPSDLSMGLGVGPWRADGQDFLPAEAEAAIQEVARACVASRKYCGMVTWNEAETEKYLEAGYRVIFAVYRRSSAGR